MARRRRRIRGSKGGKHPEHPAIEEAARLLSNAQQCVRNWLKRQAEGSAKPEKVAQVLADRDAKSAHLIATREWVQSGANSATKPALQSVPKFGTQSVPQCAPQSEAPIVSPAGGQIEAPVGAQIGAEIGSGIGAHIGSNIGAEIGAEIAPRADANHTPIPPAIAPLIARQIATLDSVTPAPPPWLVRVFQPLLGALEGATRKTVVGACLLGAMAGNFILQRPTMQSMFDGQLGPIDCGSAAAVGLIVLGIGVGLRLDDVQDRPQKRNSANMLRAVLVGLMLAEGMLPLIREAAMQQQTDLRAYAEALQAFPDEKPQAEHDDSAELAKALVGHPESIKAFDKDADKRGQADENRLAQREERHEAQRKARASEIKDKRKEMEERLKKIYGTHSWWETPFRVVFGMGLCFGIASLAPAINDVLRGLRLIAEGVLTVPGCLLAALASVWPRRRAPAPEEAGSREMPSRPPELQTEAPPVVQRRPLWWRIFYAPLRGLRDWVMRRTAQAQVPA